MAILFIIFVALTSVIPLRSVILGGFPFWHDPGRDFLLAWGNLHRLTLIGPPGGLPGIFYGPYWIWLLSLPMVVSRDPRFVVLIAVTVPYLLLFPLILWKMRSLFSSAGVFILWALFIFNFDSYLTFPWSPYLVSLVFLALTYLVTQKKSPFLIGLTAGLAPNFNFSFGLTVVFATAVFQILTNVRKFPLFLAGLVLIYSPLLVFELRHDFFQSKAFLAAFLNSAFFNSPVVGQIGMSKREILPYLAAVASGMFRSPLFLPVMVVFLLLKGFFKDRLVFFLLLCLGSMLAAFFLTKNPVWPYYFIGLETVFLLLSGRILAKSKTLTIVFAGLAVFLGFSAFGSFLQPLRPNYLNLPTLASKETITRLVISDASPSPFAVSAYSASIYTYDYDYLFRWLGPKTDDSSNLVYLIIPPSSQAVREDFVHYKTPDKIFKTVWEKDMPDGTIVIKRERSI